jgi:CRISPR-associated endonuclease/helicase Cas3
MVPDLTPAGYSGFFDAVHGTSKERRQPFDWQKRLANEVLADQRWPDVIQVPTACGKTSVLDLALFELALQADRAPKERTAPRRVCLVVDRRLVVDEATEHARRILRAVRGVPKSPEVAPELKAVADRLRALAPEGGQPLRVVRLRGGVYRDDGWASDPLTPTVIVSTVDQIGSRLLFRGYGISRRNRPVHAGLLAFDTRIIVDEAHLSTVFTETLGYVPKYQALSQESPLPPARSLSIVRLSATAGERGRERRFVLSRGERADPKLRARLEASKLATLVEVAVKRVPKTLRKDQPAKARERESRNRTQFVKGIVKEVRRLAGNGDEKPTERCPRVIGVVVNRVATARGVYEELLQERSQSTEQDAILLTGRIRPVDRDRLLECWLPKIRAGRESKSGTVLFVVATQTVEVGANLDFDAMVTEACPLDALRQRFGRLDRLGHRHERELPVTASIVIRADQAKKSDDDPIYGAAITETWKWLRKSASPITGRQARRTAIDFGVNALDELISQQPPDDITRVLSPTGECPMLLPAHLDAWAQTNPSPLPDPDVAPFLHGRPDAPVDVQIVWRADLDEEQSSKWPAIVSLMPPLSREALPVPVYEVRAWLKGRARGSVADIEGKRLDVTEWTKGHARHVRRAMRWRGRGNAQLLESQEIRPGDTIVVPAAYGGCDQFGWNPQSETPVADRADQCMVQLVASYPVEAFRRPKLRFRLHPTLFPSTDEAESTRLRALLRSAAETAPPESGRIRRLLDAIQPHTDDPSIVSAISALRVNRVPYMVTYPDNSGLVIVESLVLDAASALPGDERSIAEPEGDATSLTGRRVPLSRHLANVGSIAKHFANSVGFERQQFVEAIEQAGNWHDEGKRDIRFQAWLRGSELKALASGEPIAKSGRDSTEWKPSTLFGYPRGARHEFVSVRLLEQAWPENVNDDLRALVKFLVGTHHGFGRPFPPTDRDTTPIDVKLVRDGAEIVVSSAHRLHRLDSGWTDLFWTMVRRYGWWGLAYLEALLVTADRTASALEKKDPQVQQELE